MARRRRRSHFGGVYERRGRWYVRYSVRGVRHHSPGFGSRDEAEAHLGALRMDRTSERLHGRAPSDPLTLAEFLPRLSALWKQLLRPYTVSTRKRCLKHYSSVLTRPMRDLSVPECEAVLHGRRATGLRNSTIHHDKRVLSAAWSVARRMGLLRENPWRDVRLPPLDVERPAGVSDENLARLYEAAPADLRPAVVLMGEAGLRRGEVVTLLWGDVGPQKADVTVRGEVAKSHKARVVPLTATARAMLDGLPPALPTARVCPLTLTRLNHGFRDLADSLALPDVTPHSCRHAWAQRMVDLGVDVVVLRDLMGHSSVTTTEVYFRGASRARLVDAVRRLERARHADARRASMKRNTSDPKT